MLLTHLEPLIFEIFVMTEERDIEFCCELLFDMVLIEPILLLLRKLFLGDTNVPRDELTTVSVESRLPGDIKYTSR
jgi:hypothetical protein